MGAAPSGDPARARRELTQLRVLEESLKRSQDEYWAEQVALQRVAAEAWAAHAEGRRVEALRSMRTAADREAASEKHVATERPELREARAFLERHVARKGG